MENFQAEPQGLLGFVHRVDKNGAAELLAGNGLEHKRVEPINGRRRHKDVEPGMWDFPQPLRSQLHLHLMHSVQKLEVSRILLKQQTTVEAQRRHHALHHLHKLSTKIHQFNQHLPRCRYEATKHDLPHQIFASYPKPACIRVNNPIE